jgi:nitrogen fixation/metabolism regulation signal transduction histidine kinase
MNRLTDDLRETEIRLRRSEQVAAWQMFARQTAHELKNFLMPLATTVSRIQRLTLADYVDKEVLTQSVNELHLEIQRMKNLLGAFSEFARMPAPKFQRISTDSLTNDIKSTFAEQIQSGHLSVSSINQQATIKCDPDQIGQVLLNLITNSFEANASIVELKLDSSEDRIMFEVTDDGSGIKFGYELDPFTPLLTTKPQGSGLGLAICRRIITDHGGDITFAPNPTGGTIFTFYLPKEVT